MIYIEKISTLTKICHTKCMIVVPPTPWEICLRFSANCGKNKGFRFPNSQGEAPIAFYATNNPSLVSPWCANLYSSTLLYCTDDVAYVLLYCKENGTCVLLWRKWEVYFVCWEYRMGDMYCMYRMFDVVNREQRRNGMIWLNGKDYNGFTHKRDLS